MFERSHDPQCLRVVIEAAIGLEAGVERPFAGMAKRRVAEVMRQRQGFRQILIEPELPGERAGDLGYLQRMCQPGPVVIAFVIDKNLRLVFQPPERG